MRWNDIAVSVVGCLLASTYVIANPMHTPPKQPGSILWPSNQRKAIEELRYQPEPMPLMPSSVNAATATASQKALLEWWQWIEIIQPRISKIIPEDAHREELLLAYADFNVGNGKVPAFIKCSKRTNNAINENAIYTVINKRLEGTPLDILNNLHFIRRLYRFYAGRYNCVVLTRAGTGDLYTYIDVVLLEHSDHLAPIMKSLAEQLFAGVLKLKELGIVHLDLKPENVMIDISKGFLNPKLNIIDFDLSVDFFSADDTVGNDKKAIPHQPEMGFLKTGTPGYLPPEQGAFTGNDGPLRRISLTKVDVWSAAMTLLVPLYETPLVCYNAAKRAPDNGPDCLQEMNAIYLKYKNGGSPFASIPDGDGKRLMFDWVPVLQDMLVVNPDFRVSMDIALQRTVDHVIRSDRPRSISPAFGGPAVNMPIPMSAGGAGLSPRRP